MCNCETGACFHSEAKSLIERHGKKVSDVEWVGAYRFQGIHQYLGTWEDFLSISDEFHINWHSNNFVIVGSDWWLTREYETHDIYHYWRFNRKPVSHANAKPLTDLVK